MNLMSVQSNVRFTNLIRLFKKKKKFKIYNILFADFASSDMFDSLFSCLCVYCFHKLQIKAAMLGDVVKRISVFVLPLATVATVTFPKGDETFV